MSHITEHILDEWLILDWQSGNSQALNLIVHRWNWRLWQHARRLTDNPHDASDVVQESWMAMLRSVQRLEDATRFPYWAYRIVTNKAVDVLRSRKRRNETTISNGDFEEKNRYNHAEGFDFLLSTLSIEQRAVVSLRFGEGLSLEEIALTLEIPTGTVKSRLHYALETLKNTIKEK